MCVLIAAKRKKFVKRAEIVEAMRTNPSGFAMLAVRSDNTRDSIRTLSDTELLDFFDNKVHDDDAVAFHARIPSRGDKSLANVHGWMVEGVWTGHNMTISALDEVMREDKWTGTDSEYFFRSIFGPLYKGLGDEAFKDGKFHPYLDRIIRCFQGSTNKFLFVMPDGTFVRYGTWVSEPDRKENGEVAFWASNSSYKVFERSWPEPPLYHKDREDDMDDYIEYWQNNRYNDYYAGKPGKQSDRVEFDGTTLLDAVGQVQVMRIGLKLHVLANVVKYREAMLDELPECCETGSVTAVSTMYKLPVSFATGDHKLSESANPCGFCPDDAAIGSTAHFLAWLVGWSSALERHIELSGTNCRFRYCHLDKTRIKAKTADLEDRLDAALVAVDCCVDLEQEKLDQAFVAFAMSKSRKGRPTMVKASLSDLITPEANTDEEAAAAVGAVLLVIQAAEDGELAEMLEENNSPDDVLSDPEAKEGVAQT